MYVAVILPIQGLELVAELESDLKALGLGRKWLVGLNAGKTAGFV